MRPKPVNEIQDVLRDERRYCAASSGRGELSIAHACLPPAAR